MLFPALARLLSSILANERNNVKFNFLVPGDPYHAYYQYKVRALRSRPGRIRLTRVLHDRSLPSRRTTRALRESRWRYAAPPSCARPPV